MVTIINPDGRTGFTDDELAKALRLFKGKVAKSAQFFGFTYQYMRQRIKCSAFLQEVEEECRQLQMDETELGLYELIDGRNFGAISFYLRTAGKERGYAEAQGVFASAEMIKAFDESMKVIEDMQNHYKDLKIDDRRVIKEEMS